MTSGQDADHPPLSVACLIHSLNGGGAERVMAGLASRLADRGHDVTLITFDDGSSDRHSVSENVKRSRLGLQIGGGSLPGRLWRLHRRHVAIRTAIKQARPDVVLSFCDRNNVDTLLATIGLSVPIVVCERSDPARQSLGWFWNVVRKRCYGGAACVVALTDTAAVYMQSWCHRVEVIASAVDAPPMSSPREKAQANRCVVGVGRLETEKGFDLLIQAFALASDEHPDWELVIYGEGSQHESLVDLARDVGLADRVSFPGWVQPIWEPLSQATLFCLPSRYEGFPSALLEAMSLGVPSISVDCESGPRAVIRTGENGLLVDPDVDGLADGLGRWFQDEEERERMGREGVSVVEHFGWERLVDDYEATLRSVAGGFDRRRSDASR